MYDCTFHVVADAIEEASVLAIGRGMRLVGRDAASVGSKSVDELLHAPRNVGRRVRVELNEDECFA